MGLIKDEKACYDALTDNDSATKELGDDALKVIVKELTTELKNSVTVDLAQRESITATIRIKIKRLFKKKYKYQPDQQDEAIVLILRQAETLSHR